MKEKSKVSQAQIAKYYKQNAKRFKLAKQTLKQAEASIKSQLAATQQQTALSTYVKEFKKKWTSKTECRVGYVVADCEGYKAPKGGAGG